jgi:hypothetical protein
MTQQPGMPGPPRDVPPPRPVAGPGTTDPATGSAGLGAAARALADAVTGLLGGEPATGGTETGTATPASAGRAAAGVLADAAAAVAAAARARGQRAGRDGRPGRDRRPDGDGPDPVDGKTGPRGRWAAGSLLTDLLDAAAPRLPIRDRAQLQQAYPGATEREIAAALTARAARLTAGIGVATGGLAAAQWFAPPSLLAVPLELGAQTVLVAAVEVVLVGELHELHRRPAPGDARARAAAYLTSWSTQRAVGNTAAAGLMSRLGSAGAEALRRRVARRLARSATSLTPLLVGATLAARGNHRATVSLADRVLADLRSPLPPGATRG